MGAPKNTMDMRLSDSIDGIKTLKDNSVHLIASDIPYGISAEEWDVLHNNKNSALLGKSPAQQKAGAVFNRRGKPINGWSDADRLIPKQYYDWCSTWSHEWYRVLKPGGSVFIFAGRRYAHRCICAMEDAGFSFKDMLAWIKDNAPHRAQRISIVFERRNDFKESEKWKGWRVGNLRPLFEPILWFMKPYKIGSTISDNAIINGVGPYNDDAIKKYITKNSNILNVGFENGEQKLHPTQKPLRLMQALIEMTTQSGQVVLDPYAGSGTTLLAAEKLGRKSIGFEINNDYYEMWKKRSMGIEK